MDSAPTSRISFFDQHGQALECPREWERGYVVLDVPLERWREVSFQRNGEPLEVYARVFDGLPRVVAEWPYSGTGNYRLELSDGPSREERSPAVWPRKISRDNYFQLLDDLEELPPAIAVALQRSGALAGIRLPDPAESTLASELMRLRRAIDGSEARPGLARILRDLAADPYVVLQSTEVWLPRERVRRVHPARLAQTFATGPDLDESGMPRRLPEVRVEHTPDVYENRLVRAFHDQVGARARRLQARLARAGRQTLADELAELTRTLGAARRSAEFLDEVSPPRVLPTKLTIVLLRRPAYRAALEGLLEFRRTVSVRLEDPALDAPLENLPSLYETWGTLHLIKALSEVAARLGWDVEERIVRRDSSGLYLHVLGSGRAALIARNRLLGTTVKLVPQRTYHRNGTPLRSVSYEQRPDIALEIEREGQPPRVLVFDPKYKLDSEELEGEITDGRPKKVDIDKMHAYRDAIRDTANEHAVEFAAIIYPGAATERFGAGLEALAARPGEGFEQDLQAVLMRAMGQPLALSMDAV
jgi:hypothetical protein